MLKTLVDDQVWLITQPDHARVSGYLAAHWGGVNQFARPGYFALHPEPELLRQEVVQAISEHDNGWWEWEAWPTIDDVDGLPHGLLEVARGNPNEGLQRWRLGVPRLARSHPYAALLISLHAYWLYAFGEGRGIKHPELQEHLRHPLFGSPEKAPQLVPDQKLFTEFLDRQEVLQAELTEQLKSNPLWALALEPQQLYPHLKLLQLLDSLSLLMCFSGRQEQVAYNVPRSSWHDRIALDWKPAGERSIVCDPYPFDVDPLMVCLPLRIAPASQVRRDGDVQPLTRLNALPLQTIEFELQSKASAG